MRIKIITAIMASVIITELLSCGVFATDAKDIVMQSNIIDDGDFEAVYNDWYAFDADGDSDGETATLTYEDKGVGGSQCAVISESSGGRLSLDLNDDTLKRSIGDKFLFTAKVKLATKGIVAENDAFIRIGSRFSSRYTVSGDKWTEIHFVYTMPEDVFSKKYWLQVYISEAKNEYGAYYVDDVSVTRITDEAVSVNIRDTGSMFYPGKIGSEMLFYNAATECTVTAACAYYTVCDEKTVMHDVKIAEVYLASEKLTRQIFEFDITEENKGGYIRTFLWTDMARIKPYIEAEIDIGGRRDMAKTEALLADVLALKLECEVAFFRGNRVVSDGERIVKPVRDGESILIPIETVADALTMMVERDSEAESLKVYNAYYELEFGNNSYKAEVLNFTTRERTTKTLPIMARKIDGAWYFPLDVFCEIFGKEQFVADSGLVFIGDEKISFIDTELTIAEYFFENEAETVDLYVSTTGNDSWRGDEKNPFRTLEKAKEKARAFRDKNVTVHIADGDYTLTETLKFTSADSKLGMARTTFLGEGKVSVSGGVTAIGWDKCEQINGITGIYRHKLDTIQKFNTIYEDGRMSVPARYPNRDDNDPSGSYLIAEQDDNSSTNSFLYGDSFPKLANPNGVSIWLWPGGTKGTSRWIMSKFEVSGINDDTRKITLKQNAVWEIGSGSAYYVENDFALLDAPGEFYVNEDDGYLYYYPRNPENLAGNIVIPSAGGLISIKGSDTAPVSGIEFENLTLRYTDAGDIIYMNSARNIRVEGCRLYSSGRYGVDSTNYIKNCIIKNCEVFDIAQRGIRINGGNGFDAKYNRIENNHIYNIGILEKSAPGIMAQNSANNSIIYNTVHNGPRALINISSSSSSDALKYTGEISEISSKNNLVAYNDLYDGMKESQDGGVLYSYCTYRNVIASNRVHHSDSVNNSNTNHQIMDGLYNDDLSCYTVNRNNLIDNLQLEKVDNADYGLLYAGLRQKGAGSLVENNFIVATNPEQGVFGSESVDDGRAHGVYFYNNIGYTDNSAPVHSRLFGTNGAFNILDSDYNLFYNKENKYTVHSSNDITTLEQLRNYNQMKLEENTLTEDPRFVNYENGDYRLSYDSSAHKLGIRDLNICDIGVKADFKFANADEEIDRIFVRFDGDSVEKSFRKLSPGESVSLNISARTKTGFVADLSTADIMLESDNTAVAGIDETGIIIARSAGNAKITVMVRKDEKMLSLPVRVIVQ